MSEELIVGILLEEPFLKLLGILLAAAILGGLFFGIVSLIRSAIERFRGNEPE